MPGGRPTLAKAFLTTLVGIALGVPTIWFVLYLVFADRWWWLFVANSLAPVLFIPVPFAMLVAWLLRRKRLVVAGLFPVAIAAYLWAGTYFPARADGPAVVDPRETVSVMTFNVKAGNHDASELEAAILAAGAQVVALQELNEGVGEELAALLAATHPYVDLAPCPPCGDWGSLGIFSAYPLEPVLADLSGPAARNPQVAVVHHPRGDLLVVNVHNLSTPRFPQIWPGEIARAVESREAVAAALVELVRGASVPVIALGDFNTTERSGAYRILTGELLDAWRKRGFGFGSTFRGGAQAGAGASAPAGVPAGAQPGSATVRGGASATSDASSSGLLPRPTLPDWLLRIDYVFHSEGLTTLSVRVMPWRAASDHRPVTALLGFAD